MKFPNDRKYTKDHEWAKAEGNKVTVGITDHAQSALGDVVFVDLPKPGKVVKAGETFGVVESVKAASDLYSPLDGKVVEVNPILVNEPAKVNQDPHGGAWMIKMELSNPNGLNGLMDAAAYEKYVKSLT